MHQKKKKRVWMPKSGNFGHPIPFSSKWKRDKILVVQGRCHQSCLYCSRWRDSFLVNEDYKQASRETNLSLPKADFSPRSYSLLHKVRLCIHYLQREPRLLSHMLVSKVRYNESYQNCPDCVCSFENIRAIFNWET